MPVSHPARLWLVLAGLATLASAAGSGLGLILMVTAMVCAIHRPTHEAVMAKGRWAVSGGAVRAGLIVFGAALIFQLVGLELALLMAGDVLAYVELVTAVGLIAARTRLGPVKAQMRQAVVELMTRLRPAARSRVRAGRVRRPRLSRTDDDRPGLVIA